MTTSRCSYLPGRRGIAGETPFGEPHASELQGHRGHRVASPQGDLRRSAADVDHERVALERAQVGAGSPVRQLALLGTGQDFGRRPRPRPSPPRRTPPRSRRPSPPTWRPCACDRRRRLSIDSRNSLQHGHRPGDGLGRQRVLRSTPCPRRVMRMRRVSCCPIRIGDQQPRRVRATVDRRHRGRCHWTTRSNTGGPPVRPPSGPPGRRHRPATRPRGRAGTSHRSASPTPPCGRGPGRSGGISASRSRA